MSATYVIHWQSGRFIGQRLITGDLDALAREIFKGDDLDPAEITSVDSYDVDEGWAHPVLLEDVARAVARWAEREQCEGSGGIPVALWDFIHDHGSAAMANGLRILDSTFQAA